MRSQVQKYLRMKSLQLWLNPSTYRQLPLQCPKDSLPVLWHVAYQPLAHSLEVSPLPVYHPLACLQRPCRKFRCQCPPHSLRPCLHLLQ